MTEKGRKRRKPAAPGVVRAAESRWVGGAEPIAAASATRAEAGHSPTPEPLGSVQTVWKELHVHTALWATAESRNSLLRVNLLTQQSS